MKLFVVAALCAALAAPTLAAPVVAEPQCAGDWTQTSVTFSSGKQSARVDFVNDQEALSERILREMRVMCGAPADPSCVSKMRLRGDATREASYAFERALMKLRRG